MIKSSEQRYKIEVIENSWARIEIRAKHWTANALIDRLKLYLEACAQGNFDTEIVDLEIEHFPVSHRLFRIRYLRRLRQIDLADLSGIPQSEISRYEAGRLLPSPKTAKKLAAVLHCDHKMFL